MLVHTRSVADYAETDEWNTIDVTGLGNCSRLHINSQACRKVALDSVKLVAIGYELIACTDETGVYTGLVVGILFLQAAESFVILSSLILWKVHLRVL